MKKVTYKLSNIFSLKKYNDNNLNCQSYEYPTIYGIRCAILGAIIQVDGIDKVQELFNKIKNSNIYIQYPKEFKVNGIKQKRYANSYYNSCYTEEEYNKLSPSTQSKTYCVLDRDKLVGSNWKTTMGFRQYVKMDNIVFYIDNLIPEIDMYLKNIDWLGTAKSMVYLSDVEEVNKLDNVLTRWNKESYVDTFEQHDWNSKTTFDTIYMYSKKYKHFHDTFMCGIGDIILPS